MKKARHKAGLSLVEMVIYITLLTLIAVSLLTGVRLMLAAYRDGQNRAVLALGGQLAIARLVHEIRSAASINGAGSAFGTTTGALSLNNLDQWGNATTTIFNLSGSMLRVAQGMGGSAALLPQGLSVSNFTLYQVQASSSQAIRIILTLQVATATKPISATFYDTSVMRGTY